MAGWALTTLRYSVTDNTVLYLTAVPILAYQRHGEPSSPSMLDSHFCILFMYNPTRGAGSDVSTKALLRVTCTTGTCFYLDLNGTILIINDTSVRASRVLGSGLK